MVRFVKDHETPWCNVAMGGAFPRAGHTDLFEEPVVSSSKPCRKPSTKIADESNNGCSCFCHAIDFVGVKYLRILPQRRDVTTLTLGMLICS